MLSAVSLALVLSSWNETTMRACSLASLLAVALLTVMNVDTQPSSMSYWMWDVHPLKAKSAHFDDAASARFQLLNDCRLEAP